MLDVLESLGLPLFVTIAFAFLVFPYGLNSAFAQGQLNDQSLTIQVMVDGLASPTSLIFIDNNNILLLEKGGNVRLISNGVLQPEPVLQIEDIESNNERGLLGIAYDGVKVYLFVTENGAQVEGTSTEYEVRNRVIAMLGTAPL
jgi:glucose/arabinose dehydrogenase